MGGHYMPPPPDGVILRPPSSGRVKWRQGKTKTNLKLKPASTVHFAAAASGTLVLK